MAEYVGTSGNDVLVGTQTEVHLIFGLEGNDRLEGGPFDDGLYGGPGNDTLIGGAGNDILDPGAGDDVIVGGDGVDFLYIPYQSIAGAIYLDLAAGVMTSSDGNDKISSVESARGTDYADTITGDDSDNRFLAEYGNDAVQGGGGADWIEGGNGADTLAGGAGNDTLTGGDDDDLVQGGAGDDLMVDWWGNDTFDGGDGIDTLDLSPGSDAYVVDLAAGTAAGSFLGTNTLLNIENIIGAYGNDVLTGDAGSNNLRGDEGSDTLRGGGGDDTLQGGSGTTDRAIFAGNFADYTIAAAADGVHVTDKVAGRDGADWVTGVESFQFADTVKSITDLGGSAPGIVGTAGRDYLNGDAGPDTIDGADGDDSIYGWGGDNVLIGGGGDDVIGGYPGNDIAVYRGNLADYGIEYWSSTSSYTIIDSVPGRDGRDYVDDVERFQFADGIRALADLSIRLDGDSDANSIIGAVGGDRIYGYAGDDHLSGRDGGDLLDGGDGNDWLYGEQGSDVLAGGAGEDHLSGEGNDDTLDGGAGNDTLNGGEGNDLAIASIGADSVSGGTGLDTIRIDLPSDRFQWAVTPYGLDTYADVVYTNAPDNNVHLVNVERIQFTDVALALDIGGSAGRAAQCVGAVAGDDGVYDPAWMGIAIKFTDAGWSTQAIMDLAADAVFGTWTSEQFAAQIYVNLFDEPAPQDEIDYLVDLLQQGYTRGDILFAVAISGVNMLHIGFNELFETGVAYNPM